jgi:chromate transporter
VIDPLAYFWVLLKASLFSTGGTGNMPIIHDDFIGRGWAQEQQFAEALAIGQISPGPTGFWVVCFGYLTYGLPGALMATLAISLPPFAVFGVAALQRRLGDHPAMAGFTHGLGLAVSISFLVVVIRLLQDSGLDWRSGLIVLVSIALAASKRVPIPMILGLAALAGALLYRT